jgi:hypothetical protein
VKIAIFGLKAGLAGRPLKPRSALEYPGFDEDSSLVTCSGFPPEFFTVVRYGLGHDPGSSLYLTQEVAEQCVLAFVSPVSTAWFLALWRARILEAVSESDVPCADPASLSAQTKRTTQNIVLMQSPLRLLASSPILNHGLLGCPCRKRPDLR